MITSSYILSQTFQIFVGSSFWETIYFWFLIISIVTYKKMLYRMNMEMKEKLTLLLLLLPHHSGEDFKWYMSDLILQNYWA